MRSSSRYCFSFPSGSVAAPLDPEALPVPPVAGAERARVVCWLSEMTGFGWDGQRLNGHGEI